MANFYEKIDNFDAVQISRGIFSFRQKVPTE